MSCLYLVGVKKSDVMAVKYSNFPQSGVSQSGHFKTIGLKFDSCVRKKKPVSWQYVRLAS